MAFLGGAVVGGVVALLLAPQSGKETREKIKDFVEDEVDQLKGLVDKGVSKAKGAVNRGRDMVEDRIEDMRDAVCEHSHRR